YSSADHGSNTFMQWPFQAWGASAVLSGHSHVYERLVEDNNFPYFVDGLGGASRGGFIPPLVPGSQVQYNADWGALLVNASDTQISFQFISEANTLIDSYSLFASPATNVPPAPGNLAATVVSESRIDLNWIDHSSNENVFKILRSTDGTNFTAVATVGANVISYSDVGLAAHTNYYYRVEGSNAAGDGPASNQ